MSQGRILAWAGSVGLHVATGVALLLGLPQRAPEAVPVMLLEMPLEETTAAPQPEAEAEPESAPQAVAAAEPPPPEPPAPELPDEPPPPEPLPPEPPPPEPPVEEPPPPETTELPPPPEEDVVAELPPPPPPRPREPPRPAPPRHRPVPPRTAAPAPQAAEPHPAAPTPAAPSAAPAPAPAPAPAAAPVPSASYIAKLLGALERQKHYPEQARWRRAQGVALLRFRMRRDGTVTAYRIERSAGDPALDEAVLAMIQRASPLPAPPPELQPGEPAIELTVPVRFALR